MKKAMRQIAGAFAELEKARLVAKLRGARERKRAKSERTTLDGRGKCEGRKSVAELRPEVIEAARKLNDGRSLRAIAAALAEQGFVTRTGTITPQPQLSACLAKAARKAGPSRTRRQRPPPSLARGDGIADNPGGGLSAAAIRRE